MKTNVAAWGALACVALFGEVHASQGLKGVVRDADRGQPVYLVNVTLEDTAFGAVSAPDGVFTLESIPSGTYTLLLRHIGYDVLRVEGLVLPRDEVLDLKLTPRVIRLAEITVTPGSFSFMDNGAPSRQTMSREDMQTVPQLGEDVFRAVNRLPGLSSGDYAAHFGIRGGRHDETLILLDGLEIYEPYHLKDFNEGALSIIDTETIEGVELMTGGFSAEYGDKRSGVFSITSRRPSTDDSRYSAGISFINARGMAMGPLGNGRGSWLVSGRSGYLDLVFNLINQNDLPSPRYHDVFAKLQYSLGDRHELVVDLLHAGDKYTFDASATTGFLDTLKTTESATNRYGNSYVWSSLVSRLGTRTTLRNLVSAGLITRSRDGFEAYDDRPDPLYEIFNERDLSVVGFKQDWTVEASTDWVVQAGFDARRLDVTDRVRTVVGQDPNDSSEFPPGTFPITTDGNLNNNGTRVSAYLSNRMRLGEPLVVDLGVRYDRVSWTGDRDLSPRVNAALRIGGRRTLRAGWGYYRQSHPIDDASTLNDDASYFPSELSEQWTVGLEQQFDNGSVLRIEGYYKDGSRLRPRYRNWKGGIDTFPESNEDRIRVFPTNSIARGVEVYYSQRLGDHSSVRGSYALSTADETITALENVNDPTELQYDATHSLPQDQRHAVNVDLTRALGSSWTLTGAYTFHSGWPGTLESLVEATGESGDPTLVVRPQKIWGTRLPNYQRLDLRATKKWVTGRGDMKLFVELVNATNHGNVFGYDYFKNRDAAGNQFLQRDEETWFTILPSVGVSWSGRF